MSQEIDQLAARVAGVVKDEVAQAELRGRTAGHAAGREEMRAEMVGQVKALEERVAELESRAPVAAPDGALQDSERRPQEREEENKRLREQVSSLDAKLHAPVPPEPEKTPSGKRGRK